MDGVSHECEILELRILDGLKEQRKPVFVDTNISIETLKRITPSNHVLVMLTDPQISVRRFFERADREKQFLYHLIMDEPDPEKAMENYRKGLMLINSQENYDHYLHSGLPEGTYKRINLHSIDVCIGQIAGGDVYSLSNEIGREGRAVTTADIAKMISKEYPQQISLHPELACKYVQSNIPLVINGR